MHGAIPPFPHYAFMAWCLVKAQGEFYFTFIIFAVDRVLLSRAQANQ
jgi:hypothetical protein